MNSLVIPSCQDFSTEIANLVLAEQFGEISAVQVEPLGEGVGLMSSIARATLTLADTTKAVIVKCIAQNANSDVSKGLNFYRNEINFYRHMADQSPIASPKCLYAGLNEETQDFLLVLEDLGEEAAGNQLAGCSAAEMRIAFQRAAEFHARFHQQTDSYPFLNVQDHGPTNEFRRDVVFKPGIEPTLALFPNYFSGSLADDVVKIGDQFAELFSRAHGGAQTAIHGDYRIDNMFVPYTNGQPDIIAVDWQNSGQGNGAHDIGYFSSQSCGDELRGKTEMQILRHYHDTLTGCGVKGYSFDEFLDDYRYNLLVVMITPIAVCGTLDPGNERGMELGRVMLTRSLSALQSMECADLL